MLGTWYHHAWRAAGYGRSSFILISQDLSMPWSLCWVALSLPETQLALLENENNSIYSS